jgi:sporulation protein YlmC with PRC-barrel domain
MVRSTPGVNAVQNNLVVDSELDIQVAQALTRDMRTRPLILPVGSYHGWVRLGGTVPSRELRSAAEAVATQVPAVRGVIALPQVTGEGPTPTRRAVQPRVGASVYAEDGQAGVVAQVVINPQSRLVTHMVVSAKITFDTNDVVGFKSASGDFLVPVEAAEVVNDESIILTPQPPSIAAYPHFEASAYPTAPFTWRPPYPYSLSMVRWYRPQAPEAARRPELQPAMAVPAMLNPDALSASLWSSATERRQAAPQHA